MKIGVLGGTGDMGKGLAVRLSLKHDLLMGSRSIERASSTALNLNNYAKGFYQGDRKGSIRGVLNEDALKEADMVIVSLPPDVAVEYLKGFASLFTAEKTIISTVVPMTRRKKLFYWTSLEGEGLTDFRTRSAAEILQDVVKPAHVVSAFQTVPAAYLYNIDALLNIDVLLAGDDELSLAKVGGIVRDIPNLRPLRVGPLENSKFIESITPLLLNAAILNDLRDPSIRIVPWMPATETGS
jgi:NADPH-dependent F420 reductase